MFALIGQEPGQCRTKEMITTARKSRQRFAEPVSRIGLIFCTGFFLLLPDFPNGLGGIALFGTVKTFLTALRTVRTLPVLRSFPGAASYSYLLLLV